MLSLCCQSDGGYAVSQMVALDPESRQPPRLEPNPAEKGLI